MRANMQIRLADIIRAILSAGSDTTGAASSARVGLTPTLSCKSRLTRLPHRGMVAAATDERFGGSEVRLPCRRAVASRPRRLGRRASGPAAFVSL